MTDEELLQIPLVVVVGSQRSGTSCTSGLLHHLGVCMGRSFQPVGPPNPKGFYEAMGLKKIVLRHRSNPERGVKQLRMWAKGIRRYVLGSPQWMMCGGKHPDLSFFGHVLPEAWGPGLHVIRLHRDPQASVRSAKKQNWHASLKDIQKVNQAKMQGWEGCPILDIQFDELTDDPVGHVERIANFLPVEFSGAKKLAAAGFVDPSLNRCRDERS